MSLPSKVKTTLEGAPPFTDLKAGNTVVVDLANRQWWLKGLSFLKGIVAAFVILVDFELSVCVFLKCQFLLQIRSFLEVC